MTCAPPPVPAPPAVADVDDDGWPEVYTTDMLPEDEFRLKMLTQFESWEAVDKADEIATAVRVMYAGRRAPLPVVMLASGVAPVVDSDESEHVLVLQHAPPGWRNWQAELLDGRPHAASGAWAGDTLGRLHAAGVPIADEHVPLAVRVTGDEGNPPREVDLDRHERTLVSAW